MRLQPRIVDILKFGKHRTPGFGINQRYYLSVLAARAPLPSLAEVVTPKGLDGSVMGFGVPLSRGATKAELKSPMERGAYALAAPDQKTVVRMLVMSKEEAGFSPPACVESANALQMSAEMRERLLSTWSLAQLTFESHHPMVFPAIRFALRVASRIAFLTHGVVADPVARAYRLPEECPSALTTDDFVDVRDVVTVKAVDSQDGPWAFTLGLQKFDLPEYELKGFDPSLTLPATDLLFALAQQSLVGDRPLPGDTLGSRETPFIVAPGAGPGLAQGVLCHRLVPSGASVDDAIRRWVTEAADEQTASL